jgi:Flp pilus assembly protein TadG
MAGLSTLSRIAKHLRSDTRASIAPTFALAMLPLMITVGSAVDYGRMTNAEQRMQAASDSVALLISKEIEKGASPSTIKSKIKDVLRTSLKDKGIKDWAGDYTWDPETATVVVDVTGKIDTTFLGVAGIKELDLGVESTAVNGSDILEIAMALDNTGSMASSNKITELKKAAKLMIAELAKTKSGEAGKAYVSIVPFSVPVRVSTTLDSAAWLGPKETTTTCSGKPKVCVTNPKTWNGCVGDRVSPNTTSITPPVAGATLFPRWYGTCNIATVMPLTNDLTAASTKVDTMVATGNTNVAIGAAWGWNMLTPGMPLSTSQTATSSKKILRYLILLTDGDNTQNTLGNGVSTIDTLTKNTCTEIKKTGITIFSIRVINGDADLLKNCATSPSYYFDVSNPATLTTVFQQILSNITKLRLAS